MVEIRTASVDAEEAAGESVALHHVLEGQDVGRLRDEVVGVGIFGPVAGDPW